MSNFKPIQLGMCHGDCSFLHLLPVWSIENQSKLPKTSLVGDQCLDRVMVCLKPFDFYDFSFKLLKYFKKLKSSFFRKLKSATCFE